MRVTKEWLPMFNETMGVEPIMINSALVSAQNRVRYYWTNIPGLTVPGDRGILLRDILEKDKVTKEAGVLFNVNPSGKGMNGNVYGTGGKSPCLTTNKGEGSKIAIIKPRPCELKEFNKDSLRHHTATATATDISGNDSIKRVYARSGKSPSLTTMQGGHRQPKVLIVPEATKKGFTEIENGNCFDLSVPNSKTRRGRNMKNKCNCLTTSHQYMRYEHPTYRKLTPLECERLQTVPDNYTSCVSNSQRYKMLGNGWTIDVIVHIFKVLLETEMKIAC